MLLRVAGASVDLVKRIPLFSDLDERELRAIADSMKARSFAAGSTVVEEGEAGVGFFVIESGRAHVTVAGREVGVLGAGDHFGEVALIGDVNRTATITADTELNCYGMTFWDFRPLVESNATIAWKLLQALARRLSAAEQRGR
jgi:CRP/FNR family cyclic AMP-dependent transcriptional regulator